MRAKLILDLINNTDYLEYKHDIESIWLLDNQYVASYRSDGIRPITNQLANKMINQYKK